MRTKLAFWTLFFYLLLLRHLDEVNARKRRPLVLISLDGFRWDYLSRADFPALSAFRREGASADWLQGTFPTKTFPSHNTIVTGRYHESHGIIGNTILEVDTGKRFRIGKASSLEPYWWDYNGTMPIWASAVRQNLKAGVYYWPGSEIRRYGTLPTATFKYNSSTSIGTKFNQLVKWLVEDKYDLMLLYHYEPDNTGHREGPDSPNITKILTEIDFEFGRFVETLKSRDLYDKVDIVITSDHGMAAINQTFLIEDYGVDGINDLKVVEASPILSAFVNNASHWPVILKKLRAIPHSSVYRRNEIPERWHYKRNRRIPDLLVVPEPGFVVTWSGKRENDRGMHGYDNAIPEMRAIFMARGPSFRKGYRKESVLQVDIYALLCDVLQLQCEPHDGDLRRLRDLLAYSAAESAHTQNSWLSLISLSSLVLLAIVR